jgi:hypothetical protein
VRRQRTRPDSAGRGKIVGFGQGHGADMDARNATKRYIVPF